MKRIPFAISILSALTSFFRRQQFVDEAAKIAAVRNLIHSGAGFRGSATVLVDRRQTPEQTERALAHARAKRNARALRNLRLEKRAS